MAAKKIQIVLDVDGKPIDVAIDATLNLKQQFRELQKELNRTQEGTREFELLSSKIGEVQDNMATTTAKSKDLFGSLSLLPGPVGAFAGSVDGAIGSLKLFTSFSFKDLKFQLGETVDDFAGIATNIGKATGITKIYTTLNNALAASFVKVGVGEAAATTGARAFAAALTATGIGALIVGLGMAVSALMEYANAAETAAEKQKELAAAQDKMAKETLDVESQSVKRQGDLLLATEKARGASAERIYKLEQQNRELLLASQQRYYNSLSDIDGEEGRKTVQLIKNTQNEIKVAEQNFRAEQLKENQAKNDKIAQQNKQAQEKIAADTKSATEMLLDLQQENDVLALKNERDRQDQELKNAKADEQTKIKALQLKNTVIDGQEVTAKQLRQKLLDQVDAKYEAKQNDLKDKRTEEDNKKEEDRVEARKAILEKIGQIELSLEKDNVKKLQQERQNAYTKEVEDLDKALKAKLISQDEYNKAVIAAEKSLAKDKERIALDQALQDAIIEKGNEDAKFMRLLAGSQNDLSLQRQTLEAKRLSDEKYFAEQLAREGLTSLELRDLNEKKLMAQLDYTQRSMQLERDRVGVQQKALDDIISIAGQETAVGRAALVAKQILAAKELILEIKRTITFSTQAAARSAVAVAEGTAQTAKIGFPQNIPMLIAYAAQAVGIISAIKSAVSNAKGSAGEGGGSGGGATSSNPNSTTALGQNYEDGGMINGPRHAQGGVLINAEGGEAVMTRGAVSMFAPMLSMMNQMGGGTAFNSNLNQGLPDAPVRDNPAMNQQPMIMKTYVVSNELTTEAEKQARLKDLSTL